MKDSVTSKQIVRWECGEIDGTPHMFEDMLGCWVSWGDHVREVERLRAELKAATESEYAFCVERDQLRAEVGKLRAAVCVLCERDGGVCAMGTHEADDDPCTPENCSTMRAVRLAAAEREALERPLELGRATRNWNYRVLCRRDNDGEPYFAVHEVYYDAEGKPTSWTCDAASPAGENALELAVDAARMAAACGLPVLAAAADNTLHQYPDCGCERCGKKQAGSAPAGAKEAREALERAASAAESADPLASKDHDLARQAAEETAAEVRAEVARLQARIDALMLEYCPGEMTPEQTAEPSIAGYRAVARTWDLAGYWLGYNLHAFLLF